MIWYWIQTRRGYDVSGCIHENIKLLYFCIGQSNNLQFSWKFASNELRNTCIYNCCRNKLNYVRFVILSLIRQHGVNGVKMFSLATLFSHFLLFLKYSKFKLFVNIAFVACLINAKTVVTSNASPTFGLYWITFIKCYFFD